MAMIDSSIQYLKGVGPAFAKSLKSSALPPSGICFLCYPRKYIDYTKPYTVVSAPYDVDSCVRATVLQKRTGPPHQGRAGAGAGAGRG